MSDISFSEKFRKEICDLFKLGQFRRAIWDINSETNNYCIKGDGYDRYYDICPYSDEVSKTLGMVKYINASFVKAGDVHFIAAQMPKRDYVSRFKSMIALSESSMIISLVENFELVEYLEPNDLVRSIAVGQLRRVVYYDELYKNLTRIRVVCWRDHEPIAINDIELICRAIEGEKNKKNIIVHCKAGVGRTGTLIMYYMLRKCGKISPEKFVDVLLYLRMRRFGLVYSESQLSFLYNHFVQN